MLHEKQVNDRRIQKTKNLLHQALGSLIREKPYDAIVVKEILDRANVGRSTFYTHFRDKDELLVKAQSMTCFRFFRRNRQTLENNTNGLSASAFLFSNIFLITCDRVAPGWEPEDERSFMFVFKRY